MRELVIPHRLFGSDVRMLACRREPDPGSGGCCKSEVRIEPDSVLWLCPRRVEVFLSAPEGASVSGVQCAPELVSGSAVG